MPINLAQPHNSLSSSPKGRHAWLRFPSILALLVVMLLIPAPLSAQGSPSTLLPSPSSSPTTLRPTPTPTATAQPTPQLPFAQFTTRLPNPEAQPQTYLADTCTYLRLRWDPERSAPGTIVAPFMFHSVVKAGHNIQAGDATSISAGYFVDFMEHAHALGFQTITTNQLIDFLESNAKIPTRSMILIVDDRRPGTVREHFLPFLEKFNWTVTLGYISGVANAVEWKTMEDLAATGHVDVQAHGFMHNGSTYIVPETPKATVLREIYAPMPLLKTHFGYFPSAFVWPGGDFTPESAQIARQAGYHLGFTAYARGPLMFNWIPLGASERQVNDPLMVLPRYWSTAAYINLDEAAYISTQAQAFANQQKDTELAWYGQNCQKN